MAASTTKSEAFEVEYVTLHGHRRAFVKCGSGPALLLLHGLGCDHTTWEPVIEAAQRHLPDGPRHGRRICRGAARRADERG